MSNCSRCGSSPLLCTCPPVNLSVAVRKAAPVAALTTIQIGSPQVTSIVETPRYKFNWDMLEPRHVGIVLQYLGSFRDPDLVIDSEEKGAYLYRWHVVPRNDYGGCYFHIQTSSDPERPLHDHPWDNMSVILAGGYDEIVQPEPPHGDVILRNARSGTTIFRTAATAHRLLLPPEFRYTITQFTMGPKKRKWGFWIDGKWYAYEDCCNFDGNRTTFKYPPGTEPQDEPDPVSGD